MSLVFKVFALVLLTAATSAATDRTDPLTRARLLYNNGEYDAAVVAAEEGRRVPAKADSADLIAARAYLQKFRETMSADDLAAARDRLRRVTAARLTESERDELLIGLGQALYFDDSAGAAAEIFDSVLADRDLAVDERERVLDWWASALDEDARRRANGTSAGVYQRIRDRMREELGRNASSVPAAYWLAVAARAQGDVHGAWDAVQAAWVRSTLMPSDRAVRLREDLDQLVVRAIAPERAKSLGVQVDESIGEWDRFKERWSGMQN